LIPLTDKPIECRDKSGMVYLLKQPTDEVLAQIDAIEDTFSPGSKDVNKLLRESRAERFRWVNEHVNIILIGWHREGPNATECPEFPTNGNPAAMLPRNWKTELLNIFNNRLELDIDTVKN